MATFDKVCTGLTMKWAEALNGFCLLEIIWLIIHIGGGVHGIIFTQEG